MSNSVTAVEARQKFGEILNRVSLRQEEIVIERAGKPLAKVVPIDAEPKVASGKLNFRDALGLGEEIWKDTDTDTWLRQERDEWN